MKVALFFDGKNFYSGWKKTSNDLLDFVQLSDWVVGRVAGSHLTGAHYYTGIETGAAANEEGQLKLTRFLDTLELERGFFVYRFPRKMASYNCHNCNTENRFTREKEVDTTMVADMLRLAAVGAFDVMVLVSGDADHAPAVEGVRSLGKMVYIASWKGYGVSPRLRQAAFDHIDLSIGLDVFRRALHTSPPSAPTIAASPESASADSQEEAFLSELKRAERQFSTGYVGARFFVARWRAEHPQFPDQKEARERLLALLVEAGRVIAYDADDGMKAIRSGS